MLSSRFRALPLVLLLFPACKQPAKSDAPVDAPSAVTSAPQGVRFRVAIPPWPRSVRYFAQPHVYVDQKRAKIALQVGADHDSRCTYSIEEVDHDRVATSARKMAKLSRATTTVVVHFSNSVDATTIDRALRMAKTIGLDVLFSVRWDPPSETSAPDCIPSTAEFDGANMFDPFVRSWAILGACSARCGSNDDEERCVHECVLAEEKKPLWGSAP